MIVTRRLWRTKPLTTACRYFSPAPVPEKLSPVAVAEPKRCLLGLVPRTGVSRAIKSSGQLNLYYFLNACCYTSHAAVAHLVDGMVDIPLAQTGEGIAECELLKWFVQQGDKVEEFQPLCEVQSDKATIEITSRYKGKVLHILHTPGDIVKVKAMGKGIP